MLAWISLNSRCHPLWQANSQTETEYPKSARVLQWNNLDCAAMNSLKGDEDGFTVQTPKALLEIKIEVILNRYWEIQDLYTQASPLHRAKHGSSGLSPAFLQSCRHAAAEVLQRSCFCKQLQGSQEMFAEILRGTIMSGNCQGTAFCLISYTVLPKSCLKKGISSFSGIASTCYYFSSGQLYCFWVQFPSQSMSEEDLPQGKAKFFPAISHDAGKHLLYVLLNLILFATQKCFLQGASKELLIIFTFFHLNFAWSHL